MFYTRPDLDMSVCYSTLSWLFVFTLLFFFVLGGDGV